MTSPACSSTGRYRIVADNGLSSHPFDVGTDVFDRVVRATQRWFYFQRAFTAIDRKHAEGPWVHPSDADKAPPGVIKGWHDAGDLSIYNASASAALFWMLETFSDFAPDDDDTNIPESGNGVPDLLDEARWGLEWMLSVQGEPGGSATPPARIATAPTGPTRPTPFPATGPARSGRWPRLGPWGHWRTPPPFPSLRRGVRRPLPPGGAPRLCLLRARPGENSDGPSCPAYRADGDPRSAPGAHVRRRRVASGDGRAASGTISRSTTRRSGTFPTTTT